MGRPAQTSQRGCSELRPVTVPCVDSRARNNLSYQPFVASWTLPGCRSPCGQARGGRGGTPRARKPNPHSPRTPNAHTSPGKKSRAGRGGDIVVCAVNGTIEMCENSRAFTLIYLGFVCGKKNQSRSLRLSRLRRNQAEQRGRSSASLRVVVYRGERAERERHLLEMTARVSSGSGPGPGPVSGPGPGPVSGPGSGGASATAARCSPDRSAAVASLSSTVRPLRRT